MQIIMLMLHNSLCLNQSDTLIFSRIPLPTFLLQLSCFLPSLKERNVWDATQLLCWYLNRVLITLSSLGVEQETFTENVTFDPWASSVSLNTGCVRFLRLNHSSRQFLTDTVLGSVKQWISFVNWNHAENTLVMIYYLTSGNVHRHTFIKYNYYTCYYTLLYM